MGRSFGTQPLHDSAMSMGAWIRKLNLAVGKEALNLFAGRHPKKPDHFEMSTVFEKEREKKVIRPPDDRLIFYF